MIKIESGKIYKFEIFISEEGKVKLSNLNSFLGVQITKTIYKNIFFHDDYDKKYTFVVGKVHIITEFMDCPTIILDKNYKLKFY